MPESLGTPATTLFEKSESHKLHHEFVCSTNVFKGQPVVLHTDGTIKPKVTADHQTKVIGIALHDGVAANSDKVTVAMRAFMIVNAESGQASLPIGPVKVDVYNATTNRVQYILADTATDTYGSHDGWALEAGNDGDAILVAIKA